MKKVLLLLLLSFGSNATPLNVNAVYYCSETAATWIHEDKPAVIKPGRFVLNYKDRVLTLKSENSDNITWTHDLQDKDSTSFINATGLSISAASSDGSFYMQTDFSSDKFIYTFYSRSGGTETMQVMTKGICQVF